MSFGRMCQPPVVRESALSLALYQPRWDTLRPIDRFGAVAVV